ncbi:selenide, water dikinase SelD [Telmatocola sphagniphila]|uniref:Selenide, water dikinase n=1 Tax=Telmatocola sphagniphila TaxID=1123043 RepID=A0A8E6EWB9_9BACT|nr:selenide, water dikinase SelD [Telmatocola sphagniphila]QVL29966.1 selenide, water dikinase SelD [Telmatocola sphagniphila]
MTESKAPRLTDYASCAGCAAKIAPGNISRVLSFIPQPPNANVLVGTETHDDAGIYQLTDEIALVQTLDFFPPIVDDPFIYGQIAAANALSDVYAMGGEPKTVLNLVGYPDNTLGQFDWLGQILQGGAERCREAGAFIIGGHTVRDAEIKFGLSVTGVVHPQRYLTNAGAKPGDLLILTKPLGTGFVTTAAKKDSCPAAVLKAACDSMTQLNKVGKEAALAVGGVHSMTDITGFGLAGHGFEMADGSQVTLAFDVRKLPIITGILENKLTQFKTRASKTNFEYVESQIAFEGEKDPILSEFLWDAQTSGGLLISVAPEKADLLRTRLREMGATFSAIIGEVKPKQEKALIFRF